MSASYGLVEVDGNEAAVDCLNAMSRAAKVRLLTWHRRMGDRLVTLIVQGSEADVTTAVRAAKRVCAENQHEMRLGGIIPSPNRETEQMVLQSAQRLAVKK